MTRLQPWTLIAGLFMVTTVAGSSNGSPLYWLNARAAIVRDSLFFDGGFLARGDFNQDGVRQSQLNFSIPFDTTSNFSQLIQFANYSTNDPLSQPHLDGFMFADNNEWYTFGGRVAGLASKTNVDSDITWFGIYQPNTAATGAPKGGHANWQPPSGNYSNLHVTNGAGVNVPSESVGFYFSGLQSPNGTEMSLMGTKPGNSDFPTRLVDTMLMVNMSSYQQASWSEIPLPDGIARAEAMLAWIPVGPRGLVVVIGGVPYPADLNSGGGCAVSSNYTTANLQAPTFMTNLSIYDINTGNWYSQTTNGPTPPQLAQACAVVASAPDNTSYNVYLYGGYPGGVNRSTAVDDVWILSVPSFTWIQVASNDSNHGRTGHVCAKPYPDQMMVIGGAGACGKNLNGTFADVFNLSSLTWTGKYDPSIWSNYTVPTQVSNAISTATATNMDSGLLSLFRSAYTGKEAQYYPYPVIQSSNGTNNGTNMTILPTPSPTPPPTPARRPSWEIPVAVVVSVVGAILIALVAWFCIRRKRKSASDGRQSRVVGWLRGQPAGKSLKSDDETTQIGSSPGLHEVLGDNYFKQGHQTGVAELNSDFDARVNGAIPSPLRHPHSPGSNTASAELHSHSIPAELSTEARGGFVPITPNIRNHPMYPPSLGRHDSGKRSKSASSPDTSSVTPYKGSQNRSKEQVLGDVPDDMILDQVRSQSPRLVPAPVSPDLSRAAAAGHAGDVSPELKTAEQNDTPITPPQRFTKTSSYNFSGMTHRPSHTRNTSSLSSGLSDLSNAIPAEGQQRVPAVSPVTASPSTVRSAPSPAQQSPMSATSPEGHANVGLGIRRKEVGTTPQKVSGPNTL